jgi:hypothetical protein
MRPLFLAICLLISFGSATGVSAQTNKRVPIKATAREPIKQAGYISATSATHAQSLLRNAAGPYIGSLTEMSASSRNVCFTPKADIR